MSGTVVFITGASGFIGRALADHFQARGYRVAGVDVVADPGRGVVAGDITQAGDWRAALEGASLVIHTAAVVSNTAPMDLAWAVNVKATADLLEASCKAGVRRFVQLSSIAAFGFDFDADVDETRPLRPMGNTYVDTKIASEHAVLAFHGSGRMECTVVRPGDVYGPGSRPWVVLPLEMMQRGQFLLPAHGLGLFSPVYIDDLVAGIALAAESPEAAGQIFTLSGGAEVTCAEFFGYHARMLGRGGPPPCVSTRTALLLAETGRRALGLLGRQTELGRGTIDMLSRRAGYSIGKARSMLGYEPRVGLEEGMRRTESWARERGLVA